MNRYAAAALAVAAGGSLAFAAGLGVRHPTVVLQPGDTVMVVAANKVTTVVDTVTKTVVDTVKVTQTVTDTITDTLRVTDTVKVCDTIKPPPPPPPDTTPVDTAGVPTPGPTSTVVLDMRQSLQQAQTIDQAFSLFGIVDHTPYSTGQGGWNFTTNANGSGLHAFRVDWGTVVGDEGIRVIHYLQNTTGELWAQWKGRVGRWAGDPAGFGAVDSYAVFPQSNACKRALFERPDNQNRMDFTVMRYVPEGAEFEMGQYNLAVYSQNPWNFNALVGAAPYTMTWHVKAASTATSLDGVAQMWVNGTLVIDVHNAPGTAEQFDRWEFPTICTNVPQNQSEYFWDLLVWTP